MTVKVGNCAIKYHSYLEADIKKGKIEVCGLDLLL